MSKLSEHLELLLRMQQYENPYLDEIFTMPHYRDVIALCESIGYNHVIIGPNTRTWNLLYDDQPVMYVTVNEMGKPYICGCWKTIDLFIREKGTETGVLTIKNLSCMIEL